MSERVHKKARMSEPSTSASNNTIAKDTYIRTRCFEAIKKRKEEGRLPPIIYVVGAKYVGKTSLLLSLSLDFSANFHESPLEISEEQYENYSKDWMDNKKTILIIDNIQWLPQPSSKSYHVLRRIMKGTRMTRHSNWNIIVSSSRHGILDLFKKKFLSVDEPRNLICVNPEKDVGERLFDRLVKLTCTQEQKSEILTKVGWLPGAIERFCTLSTITDDTIESWLDEEMDAIKMLITASQGDYENPFRITYDRVLAILSSGRDVNLHNIETLPALLSWTFMKSNVNPLDIISSVSVVSPCAQQACLEIFLGNKENLKAQLECLYDVAGQQPSVGFIYENLVFTCLKEEIGKAKYFYFHPDDKTIKSDHMPSFLGVSRFLRISRRDLKQYISDNHITNAMILARHATQFDIAVIDEKGEIHAIQLSISDWQTKCNDNFYKADGYNYKYIMTTREANPKEISKIRAKNFKEAFEDYQLRILDPTSFISDELLQAVRKFK